MWSLICRYIFSAVLIVLTLNVSYAQEEVQQEAQQVANAAKAAAEKFFVKFSVPTAETRHIWNMKDVHIFGRGMVGAGVTQVTKVTDSPETFEVLIPFWCTGTTLAGEPLKLQRILYVKILRADDKSDWQVQRYEFRNDKPLTFEQQIFAWLRGVMFLLVLLIVWSPSLPRVVAEILPLPVVGILAYVCFGSVSGTVLGLVAYIVVATVLIGLSAAIAERGITEWSTESQKKVLRRVFQHDVIYRVYLLTSIGAPLLYVPLRSYSDIGPERLDTIFSFFPFALLAALISSLILTMCEKHGVNEEWRQIVLMLLVGSTVTYPLLLVVYLPVVLWFSLTWFLKRRKRALD